MTELEKCIESLRRAAKKPGKFARLKEKYDRLMLEMVIDVGDIGRMRVGFDNHKNHQRPHVHVEIPDKEIGRISVAIDNGEVLAPRQNPKLSSSSIRKIQDWIGPKKECLKFIYSNIQHCKNKEDFDPLIDAMNRYAN